MYAKKRALATRDLTDLRADYLEHTSTSPPAVVEEAVAEEAEEAEEAAGEEAAAHYEEEAADDFGNDHWDNVEIPGEEAGMDEEMDDEATPINTLGPGPHVSFVMRPGSESSSHSDSPTDSE